MKLYHKFFLYQNKWIHPYIRVALGVMTALTYLASILLIVGLVYEHGFTISATEAHQLQRLYHGVWIVFLVDISLLQKQGDSDECLNHVSDRWCRKGTLHANP